MSWNAEIPQRYYMRQVGRKDKVKRPIRHLRQQRHIQHRVGSAADAHHDTAIGQIEAIHKIL
jgi:hypothetical protein